MQSRNRRSRPGALRVLLIAAAVIVAGGIVTFVRAQVGPPRPTGFAMSSASWGGMTFGGIARQPVQIEIANHLSRAISLTSVTLIPGVAAAHVPLSFHGTLHAAPLGSPVPLAGPFYQWRKGSRLSLHPAWNLTPNVDIVLTGAVSRTGRGLPQTKSVLGRPLIRGVLLRYVENGRAVQMRVLLPGLHGGSAR
ncbi:MAG TPA: hypothetical protein VFB58_18500 [Chloroflexota bacterium]|nr:hypothetical protein [Chloroflexota bacterium]